MANIAVVFPNKDILVPSFEKTMAGTTVLRFLEYIENTLIPQKVINRVIRDDMHYEKARDTCVEAMILGGDACVPILNWDNKPISKEKGPIATLFQEFLKSVFSSCYG